MLKCGGKGVCYNRANHFVNHFKVFVQWIKIQGALVHSLLIFIEAIEAGE
jgi:hypothetical protein